MIGTHFNRDCCDKKIYYDIKIIHYLYDFFNECDVEITGNVDTTNDCHQWYLLNDKNEFDRYVLIFPKVTNYYYRPPSIQHERRWSDVIIKIE